MGNRKSLPVLKQTVIKCKKTVMNGKRSQTSVLIPAEQKADVWLLKGLDKPGLTSFPVPLQGLFQQFQGAGVFRIPGPQFPPESPGQNGLLQQVDLGKGGLNYFFTFLFS